MRRLAVRSDRYSAAAAVAIVSPLARRPSSARCSGSNDAITRASSVSIGEPPLHAERPGADDRVDRAGRVDRLVHRAQVFQARRPVSARVAPPMSAIATTPTPRTAAAAATAASDWVGTRPYRRGAWRPASPSAADRIRGEDASRCAQPVQDPGRLGGGPDHVSRDRHVHLRGRRGRGAVDHSVGTNLWCPRSLVERSAVKRRDGCFLYPPYGKVDRSHGRSAQPRDANVRPGCRHGSYSGREFHASVSFGR